MKFSVIVALAVAALAEAKSIDDMPECSRQCLKDAIEKDGNCKVSDMVCVCGNFGELRLAAAPCILKTCGPTVAVETVLPEAQKLCKADDKPEQSSKEVSSAAPASTSLPASSAPGTSAAHSEPHSVPQSVPQSVPASSEAPKMTSVSETEGQHISSIFTMIDPSTITDCGGSIVTTPLATYTPQPPVNMTSVPGGVVVNAAAGMAPLGGLAMLALGALAL